MVLHPIDNIYLTITHKKESSLVCLVTQHNNFQFEYINGHNSYY